MFNVLLQCCSTALTCTALHCTSLQVKCILSRAPECSALHCVSQTSLHCRGKHYGDTASEGAVQYRAFFYNLLLQWCSITALH